MGTMSSGGQRVDDERPGRGDSIDLYARARAYESVQALLSDDHNEERGVEAARGLALAVFAEAGVDGLAEVAVELSSKLASAIERIAVDQGVPALDLADLWFLD
jgi:hypothetical protein